MDKDNFEWVDWLIREREKRNWTQVDLAYHAGITKQTVNDYEKRRRANPDERILVKIAQAFGYPPEEALRIARKLPAAPELDLLSKQITHVVSGLPNEEKENVLEYARLRRRMAEERGIYGTKRAGRKPATSARG